MRVSSSVTADTVIVFAPGLRQNWGFTVPTPQVTLRCNTFRANSPAAVGVRVRPTTDFVSVLGGNGSAAFPQQPNGNSLDGLAGGMPNYFAYDANSSSILTYYSYASTHEYSSPISTASFRVQRTGSPTTLPAAAAKNGTTGRAAATFDDQTTGLLGEPHPNPATERVAMSYRLPKATATALLVLYDLTGRPVATQPLQAGQGEVQLAVRGLAAGLYLGVLQVEGHVLATRKLAVTH